MSWPPIAKIAPAPFRQTRPPISATLRSSRLFATPAPLGQATSSASEAPGEWGKANLAYSHRPFVGTNWGSIRPSRVQPSRYPVTKRVDPVICQAASIAMVGMAGQHRHRPVDLFHQHDSDKLMW